MTLRYLQGKGSKFTSVYVGMIGYHQWPVSITYSKYHLYWSYRSYTSWLTYVAVAGAEFDSYQWRKAAECSIVSNFLGLKASKYVFGVHDDLMNSHFCILQFTSQRHIKSRSLTIQSSTSPASTLIPRFAPHHPTYLPQIHIHLQPPLPYNPQQAKFLRPNRRAPANTTPWRSDIVNNSGTTKATGSKMERPDLNNAFGDFINPCGRLDWTTNQGQLRP